MSGPRAPHSLRHEPQSTPLKFEEPLYLLLQLARTTRPKEPDEKGHDHHNEDDHECPHGLSP
jgi:hypothetical protein